MEVDFHAGSAHRALPVGSGCRGSEGKLHPTRSWLSQSVAGDALGARVIEPQWQRADDSEIRSSTPPVDA